MRTVLFLGAGASAPLGYPMTPGIMPLVVERLRGDRFDDPQLGKHRQELLDFLIGAFPGLSQADSAGRTPTPAITDVLSLLDHCAAFGESLVDRPQGLSILAIRRLLERAIVSVLLRPTGDATLEPQALTDWIARREAHGDLVTVISTNYDVSVDFGLLGTLPSAEADRQRLVDFGFTWRSVRSGDLFAPSRAARVRLYKLHGSLNWLRCDRCSFIYVNFLAPIAGLADEILGDATKCHCGREPLRAVLVTPSYVRDVRESNLLSVWQHASDALRGADRWIFVGYSLPSEDIAVRSMALRARLGRGSARPKLQVDVVQYGNNRETEDRYRLFFPYCRYTTDGFAAFLAEQAAWH